MYDSLRGVAEAELGLTIGHDCLANQLYPIGVKASSLCTRIMTTKFEKNVT